MSDLQNLRKTAGISAREIAASLGVTTRTVQRWETGEVAVKREMAQRFRLAYRDLLADKLREVTKLTLSGAVAMWAYDEKMEEPVTWPQVVEGDKQQ